jgi:hypothetical protein
LCCSLVSVAQEWDYSYTQYTKNDGLPSNTIYCVTSDKNGILWLGTDAGVVRFDGYNVKVFNTDDGLPSNDVFEIVCDSKNRLWLTTFKSDITFIQKEKVNTKYNNKLIDEIDNKNAFPRIYEDNDRNIWIRTVPLNLFKITPQSEIIKYPNNYNIKTGCNITELNNTIYFIGSFSTLCYDKTLKSFNHVIPEKSIVIDGLFLKNGKCYFINSKNEVSVLDTNYLKKGYFTGKSLNWNLPLQDSTIWVMSQKGFKVFNLNNIYSPQIFLNGYSTSFFHYDKNKHVWLATLNSGLFKLNSLKVKNTNIISNYIQNSIISVYVNAKNIIVGNNFGDVYILDKETKKVINHVALKFYSLTSFRILNITNVNKKFIITTDRGVIEYDLKSNLVKKLPLYHAAIKNVYLRNDSLIILDNDGIRYYNKNTFSQNDSILVYKRFYSYCEYKDKKVVGSQDSLYYIDKVFKPYPLDIHFNFRAVDLLVKDSLLIATTAEKGVFFINDHKVVKNINNSNGLSSNTCYKSVIYKDALYTATNKGINVYNFTTDSLYHLFESDGLPSNTVFDLKVFNDTIYAATEAGLSVIPLTAIPHFKSFPLLATPIVAGRDTFYDLPAQLGMYTDQEMTLVLNGLSYGTKTPVRYHYKIINSDTNYKTGLDQHIQINNLNHGNYTFTAYAENSEGIVSNTLNIPFTVKPYFYQTSWFKIFIIIVYFILIYVFTLWMIARTRKKEKRKNELNNKVRNLELAAWKSAINPHFIFNSLNNLQGLFLNNDIDKANRYTQEFSDILRKTIENSGKLFLTIDEEIKYLKNYLSLEVIKRDNRFEYEITTTDEKLLSYYIPSLIIQSIIENSLKHGIKDQLGGFIKVIFAYDEKNITCTIQDNGIGFQESNTKNEVSKGIKLLKHKLSIVERLLKKKFIFEFHNRYNEAQEIIGAETIFIFPILNFENESYLHSNHY